MWFKKKKQEKIRRCFRIPDEDVRNVLRLIDECQDSRLAKYELWKLIGTLYPESNDQSTDWHIHVHRSTTVFVREGRSEEWEDD